MNKKLIRQPFILIFYGPTGVGKTDIALSVARQIPSEIINMDVGQFYTPLSVGTAKPDWKNDPVPHHLFDILDGPRNYTVVEYRNALKIKIEEILGRGNLPIVVGGSAFYLQSLLFPPLQQLSNVPHQSNVESLSWGTLYAVDPQRAMKIEKNDTYRIARALEIWNTTGKLPACLAPSYNPFADFLLIYTMRDIVDLNKRINDRIYIMMQQGWLDETKKLIGTPWQDFIQKKKLIGYNEIFDFLKGKQDEVSFNNMIDLIGNKTRQYAKRQRTFWRKLERELKQTHLFSGNYVGCIELLNLTNTNFQLYINELLKRLSFVGKKNE